MRNPTNTISNHATREEKVRELLEQLEQGVQSVFASENYARFLRTMSKFRKYSFRNAVLIWMQKPDASLVAGYNDWQKKFHRQVRKGEKGIRIFAPVIYAKSKDGDDPDAEKEDEIVCCKVVSVFDVSQTDGEELPTLGVDELTGTVEQYPAILDALERISPVPMGFEPITTGAHGYYSHTERRIAINENMSELQTVKTAIHEIAHAKLHALPEDGKRPKDGPDQRTREVQAESVAYIVCQHFGLDTSDYSFGYVAGWSSGKKTPELASSMDVIRKASQELIDAIEKALA